MSYYANEAYIDTNGDNTINRRDPIQGAKMADTIGDSKAATSPGIKGPNTDNTAVDLEEDNPQHEAITDHSLKAEKLVDPVPSEDLPDTPKDQKNIQVPSVQLMTNKMIF